MVELCGTESSIAPTIYDCVCGRSVTAGGRRYVSILLYVLGLGIT